MATHTKRRPAPGVETDDTTSPRFAYVSDGEVFSRSLYDLAVDLEHGYYSGDGTPWETLYAVLGSHLEPVQVVMLRDHEGRLQQPDKDFRFQYTYEVVSAGSTPGHFYGSFSVTIDGRA